MTRAEPLNFLLDCEYQFAARQVEILDVEGALFETMRVRHNTIPLWPWHRQRMHASCIQLGWTIDSQRLRAAVEALLIRRGPFDSAIVKLIYKQAHASGFPRVYLQIINQKAENRLAEEGVALVATRFSCKTVGVPGLKYLNRSEYNSAVTSAGLQANEYCLLLDRDRYIIETNIHNVFAVKGGELMTPPLSDFGVIGVARSIIVGTLAPQLALPVRLQKFDLSTFYRCDEVFVCNAVRGVWPVTRCRDSDDEAEPRFWAAGNYTKLLQKNFRLLFSQAPEINANLIGRTD